VTVAPSPASDAGASPAPAVPEVEREVVVDMLRRALPLVVPALVVAWLVGGPKVAASVGLAVAIVLANFACAAGLLSWGARTSPAFLLAAALGGFLLRMGLVVGALLALRHQPWISFGPLGVTLLGSHVALLAWEARRVSATLAFPGLKPLLAAASASSRPTPLDSKGA